MVRSSALRILKQVFPAFLRMLNSLATTGKVVLSKRYVLAKGILVENQTGLVKDSVDQLSADRQISDLCYRSETSKGAGCLRGRLYVPCAGYGIVSAAG
jgi:hypothetical protein